jgi:hypothetical protein
MKNNILIKIILQLIEKYKMMNMLNNLMNILYIKHSKISWNIIKHSQ